MMQHRQFILKACLTHMSESDYVGTSRGVYTGVDQHIELRAITQVSLNTTSLPKTLSVTSHLYVVQHQLFHQM